MDHGHGKNGLSSKIRTLAIPEHQDELQIRKKYRPFILETPPEEDWIDKLELETVMDMAGKDLRATNKRLKVLVLYGSLRRRSVPRHLREDLHRRKQFIQA